MPRRTPGRWARTSPDAEADVGNPEDHDGSRPKARRDACPRGERDAFLEATFKAIHVDARKLHEADEVRRTLVDADLHADAYFAAIEKDDIKERLRLFTHDAIARGVFGVPTFFVGERMFFGQDRLRFVRLALLEDGPSPAGERHWSHS